MLEVGGESGGALSFTLNAIMKSALFGCDNFNFICDLEWHKINLLDGTFCKSVA